MILITNEKLSIEVEKEKEPLNVYVSDQTIPVNNFYIGDMTQISQEVQVRQNINNIDDDTKDPTAPFYELESFSSIWDALRWRHVQSRLPVCISKSVRNRYMWANFVYVIYCIGILIINFDPNISNSEPDMDAIASNSTTTIAMESNSVLDDPVDGSPIANRLYVGLLLVVD